MLCKAARVTLIVVLWSVPTFGQEWASKMFTTTGHDFGTVARGEHAEFEFVLENLHVEDVHIAAVRASCSCTTPEIKTETLKTHEKGTIVAKYNTAAFLGPKGATLTVTFDKPFWAEVQLNVRGFIRGDVYDSQSPEIRARVDGIVRERVFASPAPLFLGVVEPGQKAVKQIVVRSEEPFRVQKATCDRPDFEITTPDGAAQTSLHVVPVTFVAPTKGSGRAVATIYIETSLGAVTPVRAYADLVHQ